MVRWLGALVIFSGVGAAGGADAEPITLGGLTFSDELGGVRLERGWGTGSLDDPIVLVEEITGDGPAILVVRGMSHRFGNRIGSHHEIGFALTKLVRNGTGEPWTLFNLELREFFDRESPFGDGLSFGQASEAGRPFRSDRFAETIETREPFDGVQFVDGLVGPGQTVTVSVVVTDTTPRFEFYLLQKRDSPLAGLPRSWAGSGCPGGPARDSNQVIVTGTARGGANVGCAGVSWTDPIVWSYADAAFGHDSAGRGEYYPAGAKPAPVYLCFREWK
jgi:hypothetical protein